MSPLFQGMLTILIGVGGCVGYFLLSNLFIDKILFRPVALDEASVLKRRKIGLAAVVILLVVLATGVVFMLGDILPQSFVNILITPVASIVVLGQWLGGAWGVVLVALLMAALMIFSPWAWLPKRAVTLGENINRANIIRPWLFLFPALSALSLYLLYPVVGSFYRSLFNRSGDDFIGFGNYSTMFADTGFQTALLNNFLWVLVVPAGATFLGLLVAQLTDRLVWGNIAKSIIFMPMAISFVGASLIWKFVYANNPDIGLINAIRDSFGAAPLDPLQLPFWNNFFLMFILVWIQTGFAMVILSAALRGIPEETIEAAIIDGANPFQIFFKIKVPQIMGTIVVVWTTITILVLKVFDIVYTMTGGNFGTEILPSYMMSYMFRDDGRATAVAFVIMIIVLPVMIWNIRQARAEMK
ncbi:maltose ABC transporter membrane protein /trehalose ABC transporter membrane protein /sucrose ABC transporter membrane protein [Litoreibacter ascidiaceicola]|uniref:Maltose ABC transporter membrane protein /trehalose ABC transporter membrane protein /sucrose ABC transporter membrane protein n=1 Tax=Litoreibacter ascidiaceicola TaxID=1486859 RepID=A0A1M4SGW5_9RHOB|nr:sugar ABC transporter permease [Litoreibacter ascidiaceicola]SHE31473.1 maltose ABC transporter membrane protein /trehalose ABC transporter membrane protein /sucrose ABC transporter membrane protein [Litoreibacter ascidiaceicola]